nr:MAG TPA: hypothetical protein [Caudoviricetes sp.]
MPVGWKKSCEGSVCSELPDVLSGYLVCFHFCNVFSNFFVKSFAEQRKLPNFVVFKYVGRQKTRSRSAFDIMFIILSIAKIAKSLTFCKAWCKEMQ